MRRPKLLALAAAAVVLAGCASAGDGTGGNGLPTGAPKSGDGRIQVVAAESLWGDIARQIGGGQVDVTSILSDPNQDPHEYEGNVGDAATIARADVVIVNGADYDPFMTRLLGADPSSKRTVVTVSSITGVRDGDNPHIWYDPTKVLQAASAIEQVLARRDPSHAAQFTAGLARFHTGENAVIATIARIKAAYAGTKVGYTEPVPGYLVQAAGLRLGTPAGFSLALQNGADPSPGDSARFEQAITGHAIKVLLLNTQVTDPETQRLDQLAKSSHVPVVSVTETKPPNENFQTWQNDQARALLGALGG